MTESAKLSTEQREQVLFMVLKVLLHYHLFMLCVAGSVCEVRGQPVVVGFLLSPCGSQGLDSGVRLGSRLLDLLSRLLGPINAF